MSNDKKDDEPIPVPNSDFFECPRCGERLDSDLTEFSATFHCRLCGYHKVEKDILGDDI